MNFELTYRRLGERGILIDWPSEISDQILYDIKYFNDEIESQLHGEVLDTIIAYSSLTVLVKDELAWETVLDKIKKIRANQKKTETTPYNRWQIPVCYGREFAIDLEEMSRSLKLTNDEIIEIHHKGEYVMHFIGFLPGFMYLGGLDSRIHYPRRSQPRWRIDKGAVAIGGRQTGIYPKASPAGWNIIGNSPVELFDVTLNKPCFALSGDHISFKSISFQEHVELTHDVKFGRFDPNSLKL